MMLFFSTVIFLAATVVADIKSPSQRDATTNRERLARNLPPLPPKFVRELPGYVGADVPTNVHVARSNPSALARRSSKDVHVARSNPSALALRSSKDVHVARSNPLPSASLSSKDVHVARSNIPPSALLSSSQSPLPLLIVYTGRIEVRNPDTKSSLGFLQNTAGGFNGVNYGGSDDDLHVIFNTTVMGKEPFDILTKDRKFMGLAFLGGGTTNPLPILSANSGATINLSNVEQTPCSRPVKGPSGFEESSVWSIDPQTKEITAHWINPDGSSPPTRIAYDTRKNIIFFTGNIDLYNNASYASAFLVVGAIVLLSTSTYSRQRLGILLGK